MLNSFSQSSLLGIDAPKEVKVYREEIVERMKAETERGKDAA